MQIKYGLIHNNIDVTNICFNELLNNNIIVIPSGEYNRSQIFTDPTYGFLKKIFIIDDEKQFTEYDYCQTITINLTEKTITKTSNQNDNANAIRKLNMLHSKLQIKHGHFRDEYPEQIMAATYLSGNEKVLEIGANIGRNSLIIASIVQNNNFVSLECDTNIANQLRENRDLNNLTFHIENSALSKRKLIQKGWDTMVSDVLLHGYKPVNTITLEELNNKYNIEFDTLVLDCEGAFYYILMDMPEILNNISLIIMENDYHDIQHKRYIDNILKKNKFYPAYTEAGGWGPCDDIFFQVWKKN
jgi:FkbM family methyltransferase